MVWKWLKSKQKKLKNIVLGEKKEDNVSVEKSTATIMKKIASLNKMRGVAENNAEDMLTKAKLHVKAGKPNEALECLKLKRDYMSHAKELQHYSTSLIMKLNEANLFSSTIDFYEGMQTLDKMRANMIGRQKLEDVENVVNNIEDQTESIQHMQMTMAQLDGLDEEFDDEMRELQGNLEGQLTLKDQHITSNGGRSFSSLASSSRFLLPHRRSLSG